ncbi:hypothetical protein, partial [Bartonella taylorii]|uniref:hypothetical protein n=1 Tax=Bartonella taylorii TaxID=33046 RepID=UPI001A7E120A
METTSFLISICELSEKYALCGVILNLDDSHLALSLQALIRGWLLGGSIGKTSRSAWNSESYLL